MARPSRNQDVLMIETAKRLLPTVGVSGMSIKSLTQSCGVNLGMFHYHFKSRAEFTRRVMESMREEMFVNLAADLPASGTPVERFRTALLRVGKTSRDHRGLIASFLQDVLNGEAEAAHFIAETAVRIMTVVAPLLMACQKSGDFEDLPFHTAMSYCASAIHMPHIAMALADRLPKGIFAPGEKARTQVLSDEALSVRVGLVIKAMQKSKRKPALRRKPR